MEQRRPREIAAGVFYGSPRGIKQQLPRFLREIRLADCVTDASAWNWGQPVWATFARQEQALQYADCHKSDAAVFTYQDHSTGCRRFLVTTYTEFWKRYKKMASSLRHHYEIIRENSPCHLYFDVEFNRDINPNADGPGMVDVLLKVLASAFFDEFSVRYEMSWTVELDSSTTEKFSRHLILRIPNTAFKDNSHAGAFVSHLCLRIHTLRSTDKSLEQLFVAIDNSSTPRLFVDEAVYSRNRSFRLVFSAKAGKTAIFIPTYRFAAAVLDDFTAFVQTLICKVDANCTALLTFDREGAGRTPSLSTVCKPRQSVGPEASPFAMVDAFVESISSYGGIPGKVRNWYWFSELGIIVYNISGNRFCERVGRQHKSNNVMYIVNLNTGSYYQKCHDPDCRGYKSPSRPVPRHLLPANANALDEAQKL